MHTGYPALKAHSSILCFPPHRKVCRALVYKNLKPQKTLLPQPATGKIALKVCQTDDRE